MAFYFGLSSVDVAARRRIAGIDVRPGRGVTLGDEDSAELWRLWQKAGITDVESADGLDVIDAGCGADEYPADGHLARSKGMVR